MVKDIKYKYRGDANPLYGVGDPMKDGIFVEGELYQKVGTTQEYKSSWLYADAPFMDKNGNTRYEETRFFDEVVVDVEETV